MIFEVCYQKLALHSAFEAVDNCHVLFSTTTQLMKVISTVGRLYLNRC